MAHGKVFHNHKWNETFENRFYKIWNETFTGDGNSCIGDIEIKIIDLLLIYRLN